MQIIRTTRAQTINTARSDALPDGTQAPANPQDVQGFFDNGFFGVPSQEPTTPSNPFDLLFTGAEASPGDGTPSAAQFNPVNVVTLDQWLMAHPEGRFYIDKYRDKMQDILDKRFTIRLDQVKQSLQAQGLSPQEITALEDLKTQLESAIVKMQQEIDKANSKIAEVRQVWSQERATMRDLDGDGAIRSDNGDILYAIGHINGQEVILQKNGDKWVPAVNPYIDPNYQPALFSKDNLSLIDRSRHDAIDPGQTKHDFDEAFQLANIDQWTKGGFTNSTFGAQIDMSVPEGIWVEKGDDGNPVKENDRLKPKAFELVTRDDGKQMYGQTPPSADQKDKYIFVKVGHIDVTTPPVGQDQNVAYVYFDLKDKDGRTIMKIRVQGVDTPTRTALNADGSTYVPANAVGVAFNAGLKSDGTATAHSTRVSPVEIDASNYISAGKILQADAYDNASIQAFYEKLGVPADRFLNNHPADGPENPENSLNPEELRHYHAGRDTPIGGFINADGGRGDSEMFTEMNGRFGIDPTSHHLTTMASYLPGDEKYNKFKTGISTTGLRGAFTGTQYNDIFKIPPPDDAAIKKLLPIGTQEIQPDNAAYGTYVDAQGGKNIVISDGGDLFARGVTFLWRKESDTSRQDQVYVEANNSITSNNKVFMHVGDSNSKVFINNGDDVNPQDVTNANAQDNTTDPADIQRNIPSANDDWFETPIAAKFAHPAADTPGGLRADASNTADPSQMETAITEAQNRILDEAIKKDPPSDPSAYSGINPDIPPMVRDEQRNYDAFFNDWEFFHDQGTTNDLSPESLNNAPNH